MNYTLHQLRVFLKVAECKSISKAAEQLFLTQPAVSIQMKRLQDQFDIPLTEVIGRQLYITDFGEKIVQKSIRILEEAEGIRTLVNQYKGLISGKIQISSVSTGKYVMPYFLTNFVREHPQVEINMDVTNKTKVVERIQDNSTDFALVSVVPNHLNVHKVELLPNKLFLVGSTRYNEYEKASISSKKLSELPLIFREEGSATRAAMEAFISNQKVQPKRALELVSNEAVKQAVIAGLGFSVMPLIGLKDELNSSMKIIKTKGLPITTNWYLVYNKGKELTPASGALLSYIETNKSQVYESEFKWTKKY